jgi:hypothetical protein
MKAKVFAKREYLKESVNISAEIMIDTTYKPYPSVIGDNVLLRS